MRTTSLEVEQVFVQKVLVDARAIAIGNAHGIYQGTAQLQFNKLTVLQKNLQTPLEGAVKLSWEDRSIEGIRDDIFE